MVDPTSPTLTQKNLPAIDAHVGRRLRMLRVQANFTQTKLAGKIGVTFQQVQKYEQGTNRLTASQLYDIAKALGTSVEAFYIGLDPNASDRLPQDPLNPELSAALRHAAGITDQNTRDKLKELFEILAASEPTPGGNGAS